MPRCIAFHSDIVGTGKTTMACNLAAILAAKGYNVCLLDGNFNAPSLHSYFDKTPDVWLNDLFLKGAEVKDIMVDMTYVVDELVSANSNYSNYAKKEAGGKLWVGFCNPKLEEIYSLRQLVEMNRRQDIGTQSLRKLVSMREELFENNFFNFSYIILDSGAGQTYWSINCIAISDILFLTLQPRKVSIENTRKLVSEVYSSFTKHGVKVYLILNRVASNCNSIIPHAATDKIDGIFNVSQLEESDFIKGLSRDLSLEVLSRIPCFRDLRFGEKKEFLSALQYPHQPFAKEIELLASSEEIRIE